MLYDEQFIKTLPAIRKFENPWLVWMLKVDKSGLLREMVEKWYDRIPPQQRHKFESRLHSTKDTDFIPAFYELVAHQYCIEEEWTPSYEPPVNGYTPDFLVTTKSGYQFILEVATIFDSKEVDAYNRKSQEVTEAINSISTSFILDLHYLTHPDSQVKPKVVAGMVREWLQKLDTANPKQRHKMNFGHHGLTLEVEATIEAPKPRSGCVFMVMNPGGQVPDYSDRIKSALDGKSKKYSSKKTKLPFVVMLADGIGRVRMGETDIDRALFGRDVITFGGDSPARWHKDRSGHFTPSNNEQLEWEGRRTGLSAVMFCSIKEKASFQMQVFHNPLPRIPLDEQVFHKMPQLLKWESPSGLQLRWVINNPETSRIQFS